jgi:hypothetical protein
MLTEESWADQKQGLRTVLLLLLQLMLAWTKV